MRAKEIRELTSSELAEELRKNREALFKLRFRAAAGKLENPVKLRALRKDVARILTVMSEKENSAGVKE